MSSPPNRRGTLPTIRKAPVNQTPNAIEHNRGTNFTLVINPASGPGTSPLPDANYTGELKVKHVPQLATTYAMKDIKIVEQEVATYAGWGLQNPPLAMAGVFLDETPWQYDTGADQYFQRIRPTVANTKGLAGSFIGKRDRFASRFSKQLQSVMSMSTRVA
ncbi:hypothetical protein H2199_009215 [Coniosporium tulheliwenetii]|uniref:Uncharacterized protein n=1 Tax=Coniosporium tulheliwenetii TaxID=3383036 RepID=A0ACC2YEZ3_9PEZI|nr:hypothetical protein H2199_009215 [Cladosporium sp. JES 115]